MGKPREKPANAIRESKPKKLLGLQIRPALRMPHEDLIRPIEKIEVDREDQLLSPASEASPAKINTQALPMATPAPETALAIETSPAHQAEQISTTSETRSIISETRADYQASPVRQARHDYLTGLNPASGFTKYPNTIIDDLLPQLSKEEQLVYIHLYRLSHGFGKDTVSISVPRLSKRTDISERQIHRVLEKLKEKGLAEKTGIILGKEKAQGITIRVATMTSLASQAGHDNRSRLDRQASHASVAVNKEDLKNKVNKNQLQNLISHFRQINTGRSDYKISHLEEDCRRACEQKGEIFDKELFNQLF